MKKVYWAYKKDHSEHKFTDSSYVAINYWWHYLRCMTNLRQWKNCLEDRRKITLNIISFVIDELSINRPWHIFMIYHSLFKFSSSKYNSKSYMQHMRKLGQWKQSSQNDYLMAKVMSWHNLIICHIKTISQKIKLMQDMTYP